MRPSEEELIALADLNFAESLRELARWSGAGEVEESGDALCVAGATRLPAGPFNAAIGTGAGDAGGALVERARAWFGARGRGFSIYVRGSRDAALWAACRAAGMTQLADTPGMVLERPPPVPELPGLEWVADDAGRAAFVDVSIDAWQSAGLAPAAFHKHFAAPSRVAGPHLQLVLARDGDGRAQATAVALLSHGIAGVYWVGTRPEARGRGLGAAVTAATARWAFERGARAVVLQASSQGEPVYRRLGFRDLVRYPWLIAPLPR